MSVDLTQDISIGLDGDNAPSVEQFLLLLKSYVRGDMRISLPCVINAVNDGGRSLDVKIPLKMPFVSSPLDGEQAQSEEDGFVIPNVPVFYPGGGSVDVTYPLSKGSIVTVFFSDQSIIDLLESGASVVGFTSPSDKRRFTYNGAYCLPFRLYPDTSASKPDILSDAYLVSLGATDYIEAKKLGIEYYSEVKTAFAKLSQLQAALTTFMTATAAATTAAQIATAAGAYGVTAAPLLTELAAAVIALGSFSRP